MMLGRSIIASVALLSLLLPVSVTGQFCRNTCPPLNDIGIPQPSLCNGSDTSAYSNKVYSVCHPFETAFPQVSVSDFKGKVLVLANFYVGCNAGRRESGVFAHVAQRYYNEYPDQIMFISSLKGGNSCGTWAFMYQKDARALYPQSDVIPTEMPLTVSDNNYEIRDDYFTTPFGHPSYVIIDTNGIILNKFVGPCCGYETMAECTPDIARSLDGMLSDSIDSLLDEMTSDTPAPAAPTPVPTPAPVVPQLPESGTGTCIFGAFSDWSDCSLTCDSGVDGTQFRWRLVIEGSSGNCPMSVETRSCTPTVSCADECIPELGSAFTIETVSTGFDSPRDVAFSPSPGLHLGAYSEGRSFHPDEGEEAWVVNGANHSVSIVASLGSAKQTTISRRDRGYYHYLINATALSFNMVSDSGRDADKDSFNYWAVCNDNVNTYLDTKEPNYFMGPTLYNSEPKRGNSVNRLGGKCNEVEPCFFLHSDMLHETPACIGIAHDPETATAFGTVYWVFDSTGDRNTGHLVRYDFQQPHGPGSMDHSVAAVRRFPEIKLERGPPGVHAGMVVHPDRREVFVVSPGTGTILAVGADSGTFARTAREEYPIFSNRLPSFEYSIYECPEQRVFASGLDMPSGLALSPDGTALFVAEHFTGKIHVFEVESGALLDTIQTNFRSIGGMVFSPESEILHFVDADTNTLAAVKPVANCATQWQSRLSSDFVAQVSSAQAALGDSFSLFHDLTCTVNPVVPNASLFEQVHADTGYASNDTNVQSMMAGMDPTAVLLANRTDCGYDSELNFDALLLGGYYCHVCLPSNNGAMCDNGGECRNVQWLGYVCDNEFVVKVDLSTGALVLETTESDVVDPLAVTLKQGVTYRFSVEGNNTVSVYGSADSGASPLQLAGNDCGCASNGPLIITIDASLSEQSQLFLRSDVANSPALPLTVEDIAISPNNDTYIVTTAAEADSASAAHSQQCWRGALSLAVLVGVVALFL